MKEQEKTPEKQLNEVEIGNFPEKQFRIMIVGKKKKKNNDGEDDPEPGKKNGGKNREDAKNV